MVGGRIRGPPSGHGRVRRIIKDTKNDRSKSSPIQSLYEEAERRGLTTDDPIAGSIGPVGP